MTHRLLLELDWEIGTLQRLIGLIERRGFEVVSLELDACGGARQVSMELQPQRTKRDFSVLCRQIDRLYGICRLSGLDSGPTFSLKHRFPLVG